MGLISIIHLRDDPECNSAISTRGNFDKGNRLLALRVARHVTLHERSDQAVIYCSDQTHSSVDRALQILGFQSAQLRKNAACTYGVLGQKAEALTVLKGEGVWLH